MFHKEILKESKFLDRLKMNITPEAIQTVRQGLERLLKYTKKNEKISKLIVRSLNELGDSEDEFYLFDKFMSLVVPFLVALSNGYNDRNYCFVYENVHLIVQIGMMRNFDKNPYCLADLKLMNKNENNLFDQEKSTDLQNLTLKNEIIEKQQKYLNNQKITEKEQNSLNNRKVCKNEQNYLNDQEITENVEKWLNNHKITEKEQNSLNYRKVCKNEQNYLNDQEITENVEKYLKNNQKNTENVQNLKKISENFQNLTLNNETSVNNEKIAEKEQKYLNAQNISENVQIQTSQGGKTNREHPINFQNNSENKFEQKTEVFESKICENKHFHSQLDSNIEKEDKKVVQKESTSSHNLDSAQGSSSIKNIKSDRSLNEINCSSDKKLLFSSDKNNSFETTGKISHFLSENQSQNTFSLIKSALFTKSHYLSENQSTIIIPVLNNTLKIHLHEENVETNVDISRTVNFDILKHLIEILLSLLIDSEYIIQVRILQTISLLIPASQGDDAFKIFYNIIQILVHCDKKTANIMHGVLFQLVTNVFERYRKVAYIFDILWYKKIDNSNFEYFFEDYKNHNQKDSKLLQTLSQNSVLAEVGEIASCTTDSKNSISKVVQTSLKNDINDQNQSNPDLNANTDNKHFVIEQKIEDKKTKGVSDPIKVAKSVDTENLTTPTPEISTEDAEFYINDYYPQEDTPIFSENTETSIFYLKRVYFDCYRMLQDIFYLLNQTKTQKDKQFFEISLDLVNILAKTKSIFSHKAFNILCTHVFSMFCETKNDISEDNIKNKINKLMMSFLNNFVKCQRVCRISFSDSMEGYYRNCMVLGCSKNQKTNKKISFDKHLQVLDSKKNSYIENSYILKNISYLCLSERNNCSNIENETQMKEETGFISQKIETCDIRSYPASSSTQKCLIIHRFLEDPLFLQLVTPEIIHKIESIASITQHIPQFPDIKSTAPFLKNLSIYILKCWKGGFVSTEYLNLYIDLFCKSSPDMSQLINFINEYIVFCILLQRLDCISFLIKKDDNIFELVVDKLILFRNLLQNEWVVVFDHIFGDDFLEVINNDVLFSLLNDKGSFLKQKNRRNVYYIDKMVGFFNFSVYVKVEDDFVQWVNKDDLIRQGIKVFNSNSLNIKNKNINEFDRIGFKKNNESFTDYSQIEKNSGDFSKKEIKTHFVEEKDRIIQNKNVQNFLPVLNHNQEAYNDGFGGKEDPKSSIIDNYKEDTPDSQCLNSQKICVPLNLSTQEQKNHFLELNNTAETHCKTQVFNKKGYHKHELDNLFNSLAKTEPISELTKNKSRKWLFFTNKTVESPIKEQPSFNDTLLKKILEKSDNFAIEELEILILSTRNKNMLRKLFELHILSMPFSMQALIHIFCNSFCDAISMCDLICGFYKNTIESDGLFEEVPLLFLAGKVQGKSLFEILCGFENGVTYLKKFVHCDYFRFIEYSHFKSYDLLNHGMDSHLKSYDSKNQQNYCKSSHLENYGLQNQQNYENDVMIKGLDSKNQQNYGKSSHLESYDLQNQQNYENDGLLERPKDFEEPQYENIENSQNNEEKCINNKKPLNSPEKQSSTQFSTKNDYNRQFFLQNFETKPTTEDFIHQIIKNVENKTIQSHFLSFFEIEKLSIHKYEMVLETLNYFLQIKNDRLCDCWFEIFTILGITINIDELCENNLKILLVICEKYAFFLNYQGKTLLLDFLSSIATKHASLNKILVILGALNDLKDLYVFKDNNQHYYLPKNTSLRKHSNSKAVESDIIPKSTNSYSFENFVKNKHNLEHSRNLSSSQHIEEPYSEYIDQNLLLYIHYIFTITNILSLRNMSKYNDVFDTGVKIIFNSLNFSNESNLIHYVICKYIFPFLFCQVSEKQLFISGCEKNKNTNIQIRNCLSDIFIQSVDEEIKMERAVIECRDYQSNTVSLKNQTISDTVSLKNQTISDTVSLKNQKMPETAFLKNQTTSDTIHSTKIIHNIESDFSYSSNPVNLAAGSFFSDKIDTKQNQYKKPTNNDSDSLSDEFSPIIDKTVFFQALSYIKTTNILNSIIHIDNSNELGFLTLHSSRTNLCDKIGNSNSNHTKNFINQTEGKEESRFTMQYSLKTLLDSNYENYKQTTLKSIKKILKSNENHNEIPYEERLRNKDTFILLISQFKEYISRNKNYDFKTHSNLLICLFAFIFQFYTNYYDLSVRGSSKHHQQINDHFLDILKNMQKVMFFKKFIKELGTCIIIENNYFGLKTYTEIVQMFNVFEANERDIEFYRIFNRFMSINNMNIINSILDLVESDNKDEVFMACMEWNTFLETEGIKRNLMYIYNKLKGGKYKIYDDLSRKNFEEKKTNSIEESNKNNQHVDFSKNGFSKSDNQNNPEKLAVQKNNEIKNQEISHSREYALKFESKCDFIGTKKTKHPSLFSENFTTRCSPKDCFGKEETVKNTSSTIKERISNLESVENLNVSNILNKTVKKQKQQIDFSNSERPSLDLTKANEIKQYILKNARNCLEKSLFKSFFVTNHIPFQKETVIQTFEYKISTFFALIDHITLFVSEYKLFDSILLCFQMFISIAKTSKQLLFHIKSKLYFIFGNELKNSEEDNINTFFGSLDKKDHFENILDTPNQVSEEGYSDNESIHSFSKNSFKDIERQKEFFLKKLIEKYTENAIEFHKNNANRLLIDELFHIVSKLSIIKLGSKRESLAFKAIFLLFKYKEFSGDFLKNRCKSILQNYANDEGIYRELYPRLKMKEVYMYLDLLYENSELITEMKYEIVNCLSAKDFNVIERIRLCLMKVI